MWYGSQYIKTGVVPFLDTYPAYAAYSLRQLRTGVTNVVRVRRSSDNTESDFTAAQVSDGTLTTWVGANNGFVRTWYDQSGNGRTIGQTFAANQPKIVNAGTLLTDNGKPCIEFTTSVQMWLQGTAAFAGHTSCAFVAAYRNTGGKLASSYGNIFSKGTGHLSPLTGIWDRTSTSRLIRPYFYTGSAFVGDTNTGAYTPTNSEKLLLFHNIIGGTNQTFHINNNLQFTDTTALSPETTSRILNIGGGGANGTFYANAWEFIYFGTSQSSNRADIEANINAYYGI